MREKEAEVEGCLNPGEVEVRGPASLARLRLDIDEQWSGFKFLGLGFYQAWIWLLYNSDVLVVGADARGLVSGTDVIFSLYLLSTTALSVALIVASAMPRVIERALGHRVLSALMAVVATLATVGVSVTLGWESEQAWALFDVCAVLSGFGTAWVVLRIGAVYAQLDMRRGTMYTAIAFAFACLIYFTAAGLPAVMGLVFTALLPLIAMVCTMVGSEDVVVAEGRAEERLASGKASRGGFSLGMVLARLVIAVGVFSTVVGVVRGFMTLDQAISAFDAQGALSVFCSALTALALFAIVGLVARNFNVSCLYYPIIILAAAGILLSPLVGDATFDGCFVGVAYNCFSMMVWCLLCHTAHSSGISFVRVFGLGRGASALGTTVGWVLGSRLLAGQQDDPTIIHAAVLVMAFALVVVALLVLGNRGVADADKAHHRESRRDVQLADQASASAVCDETADAKLLDAAVDARKAHADDDGEADEGDVEQLGKWRRKCAAVACAFGLSPRELEVLQLLARGRTIDYIATELVISFNTAKSHVRHVYVKVGVHTRQELIDLIENYVL